MIPAELIDFLQSGLSALVGTCDASLRPACCRAVGVVVHEGGERMTLYVPEVAGARVIANVDENRRVALTMSHPTSHRTIQMKGPVTELRKALAPERAIVTRYIEAFAAHVDFIGLPRARVHQVAAWPAWAVEFKVEQLYTQTPGPRAGKPLSAETDCDA
jgi:hypothetical protein